MIVDIITDCLDLLAGVDVLDSKEQKNTLQNIIDTLSRYPKPKNKTELKHVEPHKIACYLFVSNARNVCKLSIFGFMDMQKGFSAIQVNLESALSLLVDDLKTVI